MEQCILGLGGTINYKHYYEPHLRESDSDDTDGECMRTTCWPTGGKDRLPVAASTLWPATQLT